MVQLNGLRCVEVDGETEEIAQPIDGFPQGAEIGRGTLPKAPEQGGRASGALLEACLRLLAFDELIDQTASLDLRLRQRLHKKRLVQRRREGTRFLYSPARKAADVSTGILTRVRRALFQSDRAAPIAALLEDESLSEDELRALRRMIDQKIRERR